MNAVTVYPAARTACIGGDATMSHLEPYGLATTGGRVSTTGVGGFTWAVGRAGWSASSGWLATTCSPST